jgi:hypothetical protein
MEWVIEIIKQIIFYSPDIQGLMLADPVTALAIASAVGTGVNYFGNQSAANTQAGAANNASQAGLQGTREGIQAQKDIYNADRQREFEAGKYLQGLMPNFDMNMPDPQNYFGQGNVNQFYDQSKSALNQTYQRDLGEAGQGAGEMAAARGLLNPSLLARQAQSGVRETYAPQFAGLEANRAGAMLQNNQELYKAMLGNDQYMNMLRQLGYSNQFQLASQFGNPNIAPTGLPSSPGNNGGNTMIDPNTGFPYDYQAPDGAYPSGNPAHGGSGWNGGGRRGNPDRPGGSINGRQRG